MKVFIESYGCTFNKADAQIMAGVLDENNIELTDSIEQSDVIIVKSAILPEISPIIGLLVESLSPPHPNTEITLPLV